MRIRQFSGNSEPWFLLHNMRKDCLSMKHHATCIPFKVHVYRCNGAGAGEKYPITDQHQQVVIDSDMF